MNKYVYGLILACALLSVPSVNCATLADDILEKSDRNPAKIGNETNELSSSDYDYDSAITRLEEKLTPTKSVKIEKPSEDKETNKIRRNAKKKDQARSIKRNKARDMKRDFQ